MYDCMVVLFWCFIALNMSILVYSKLDLYPPLQIIMDRRGGVGIAGHGRLESYWLLFFESGE